MVNWESVTDPQTGAISARIVSAQATEPQSDGPKATEAARKLAEENGIDLATVEGTGADGQITKGDVEARLSA